MGSSEAIRDLLEPALASAGFELWDVEVSRLSVKVLVDRDGGIDLDSLASAANKIVSPLLDEHPELTPPEHFTLEVSSPGVERTLRTKEHYLRYLGSELSVKTNRPVSGSRRLSGILVSVDRSGITIRPGDPAAGSRKTPSPTVPHGPREGHGPDPPDAAEGGDDAAAGDLSLAFDVIDRARTVLLWGSARPARPGRDSAREQRSRSAGSRERPAAAVNAKTAPNNDSKDLGS